MSIFDKGESLEKDVDLIYVCGGNTFHLLYSIQQSEAPIKKQIETMCKQGGLYIGSSAGAVLATPSIAAAGEVHPDKNDDKVIDYKGFGFVQQHIIPHYSEVMDEEITRFKEKHQLTDEDIVLLKDGEGVYVCEGKQTILS